MCGRLQHFTGRERANPEARLPTCATLLPSRDTGLIRRIARSICARRHLPLIVGWITRRSRPGNLGSGDGILRDMETESNVRVVEALQRFLGDAMQAIDRLSNRSGSEQPSAQALARSLAALPTCMEADDAARSASLTTGYLLPAPAGRPLDADALISTGVVGMLMNSADVDLRPVAKDLAGYLAGPPVDIWDYAITDGNFTLQDAIQVADGWELATPTADELRMLLPLPSTAAYQPARVIDPMDYSGLAMLRRVNRKATPHKGVTLRWDVLYSLATGHPAHLLWQPLMALSLYATQFCSCGRGTKSNGPTSRQTVRLRGMGNMDTGWGD
jgi:hypothetical protein